MIYDAHGYLGNNPSFAQTGLPLPLDGRAWVEMMDRAGVDGALVAPPGTGMSEDFKPDLERIASAVKEFPDRLFGWVRVKPRQGKAAVDVLRRHVEEHGFKCLKLNTLDDDYRLDDRRVVDPVVAAADELGIPVFFHTGDASTDTCTPDMVADIAADFPHTTFIIGHMAFGGVNGYPGATEQLVPAMKRAPNTVTETAGVLRCSFIQDVVDEIGADRVLLGSNGPYTPIDVPVIMIRDYMGLLSDEQKRAILGENLLRVLKIGS